MMRLVSLFLLALCGNVWAATYWVDLAGTGTGAANGTNASNLCAGPTDVDCLGSAGDTINLCNTVGRLNIPVRSGSAGSPITYNFTTCGGYIDGTAEATGSGILIYDAVHHVTIDGADVRRAGGAVTSGSNTAAIRMQGGVDNITINDAVFTETGVGGTLTNTYDIYISIDGTSGDSDSITIDGSTHDGVARSCIMLFYGTALATSIISNLTYTNFSCNGNAANGAVDTSYTDYSDELAGRRTSNFTISNGSFSNTTGPAIRAVGAINSRWHNLTLTNICSPASTTCNAIQTHYNDNIIIEDVVINGVLGTSTGDGAGIILDWDQTSDSYLSNAITVRRVTCTNVKKGGDGKCISVWKATNSTIYSNTSTDCSIGLKITNSASTGTVAYNNTFVCDLPLSVSTSAAASVVKNNIFWSTGSYAAKILASATTPTFGYNSYYGYSSYAIDKSGSVDVDGTSFTADPGLISGTTAPTSLAGMHLTASSILRQTGIYVGPYADNRACPYKVPPSIGAYEACSGDAATTRTAASARSAATARTAATSRSARW